MIKINEQTIEKRIHSITHHSWTLNLTYSPYASCVITFLDENNSPIRSDMLAFTKEELDPWGEDDSILDSIVLNKLGFTKFKGEE